MQFCWHMKIVLKEKYHETLLILFSKHFLDYTRYLLLRKYD